MNKKLEAIERKIITMFRRTKATKTFLWQRKYYSSTLQCFIAKILIKLTKQFLFRFFEYIKYRIWIKSINIQTRIWLPKSCNGMFSCLHLHVETNQSKIPAEKIKIKNKKSLINISGPFSFFNYTFFGNWKKFGYKKKCSFF